MINQYKIITESYQGQHTAPMSNSGAPLYDMTGDGEYYPDDIYSSKGLQYYGTGDSTPDRESMSIISQAKGRPNAVFDVYRAVPYEEPASKKLAQHEKHMNSYQRRGSIPSGAENPQNLAGSDWYNWAWDRRAELEELEDTPQEKLFINPGDWVTLSRHYAKQHGQSALNSNYKIIKKKVPARHLYTQGDSINEFGYDPSVSKQPTNESTLIRQYKMEKKKL